MFSKEMIREALKAGHYKSEHLKSKRILFQTRRPFTEMLERYRSLYAPTDRDNDPLFLHNLLDQGWENSWLQDCPWETEREEPLSSQYPLNVTVGQYNDIESIGFENGWTLQRSVSALIYTGLLLTYPKWRRGDKVKIEILRYPHAPYQPNEEFLGFNGMTGTVTKKSNVKLCWESIQFPHTREPIAIRKDWVAGLESR